MKGKILAIILLLNFTSILTLNAQWAISYGGSEKDLIGSIHQTSDGGYTVAGSILCAFGQLLRNNIGVIKLNSDGSIEWQKTYGNIGLNSQQYAYSIQQTNDGGYIIGGEDTGNCSIIKLFPNGNIEWQKTYAFSSTDKIYSTNSAYSLQLTNDGGYIITGKIFLFNESFYFFILKLSFNGTAEWSKIYGGNLEDQGNSVQQTIEGGYIAAGYTNSFGAGSSDAWIIKNSQDGMVEWQKTYGGSQGETANSIQQTNDGGIS